MAIVANGASFLGVDANASLEVVGGTVIITDSAFNACVITSGAVEASNSNLGDLSMAAATGNSLRASNITVDDVTLNGGAGLQDVLIDGLKSGVGRFQAIGDFRQFIASGLLLGRETSGPSLPHTLEDIANFYLQGISYRTGQDSWKFDGCSNGDIHLTVLNPSATTDNTYDGIDLIGCDKLNIYGSVRGAEDIANNNRYGIDIPSGNTNIDLWMVFSGHQTGAINDGTAGQVINHGAAVAASAVSQVIPFSKEGALSVVSGVHRFMFPVAGTIVAVRATVGTAPATSSIIVDVHKNGTTIFTTQANRPEIAVAGNASAEEIPDVTSVADGDYITVDIDQVGSGPAGSDLTVMVEWRMA